MTTYRRTPDGAGYRAVITFPTDTHAQVSIERELGQGWVSVQEWATPTRIAKPRERQAAILDDAERHGWCFPISAWPARRNRRQVLPEIHPDNWHVIVSEASTLRGQRQAQLAAQQDGWTQLINSAVAIGGLAPTATAKAAGLSRERIKQIIKPARSQRHNDSDEE